MSIKTRKAIWMVCTRCGVTTEPMNAKDAASWKKQHDASHAAEDRRKRATEKGEHSIQLVTEWMDMDDSSGHAVCSCGWRSRSAKTCWMQDMADRHLREVGEM